MRKVSEDTRSTVALEEDPRWQLIERIAATTAFTRSARLRDFLRYVSRLAIAGQGDEINEQSIGVAVFERNPNYDASVDSIVRAHAVRLRTRLDEYFEERGRNEPLRVCIPKGGYVPIFTHAPTEVAASITPAPAPSPAVVISQNGAAATQSREKDNVAGKAWRLASIVLAVISVILAVALYLRSGGAARADPQQLTSNKLASQFWQDVFTPGHTTVIVPGDNGLVLYENLTGDVISLHEYLSGFHPRPPLNLFGESEPAIAANLAARRVTTIVDLDVTTALERVPSAAAANVQIVFARDLRPNNMMGRNLILIGASEANPWVQLFEPSMNFVMKDEVQKHIFHVYIRNAKAPEPREYISSAYDPNKTIYAVVAFLPNLNGIGDVLILEGTSQAGTEAASQFVQDLPRLNSFLAKIKGNRPTIPYFEILLESHNFADSASQSQIVTYRSQ